jgi:hypothetical protein
MADIDIKKPSKKFAPHLLQAKAENANEANVVVMLIKVLEEVLGYDQLKKEIGREEAIRDKYVDLIVRIDEEPRFLIEAKAGGIKLRERHIEQAEAYASKSGVQWVLLTNGTEFFLFHLTFDDMIVSNRAFSVDLATDTIDDVCAMLSLLHKKNVNRGRLEKFWEHRVAMSPASIGKGLFHEETLTAMRRVLNRVLGVKLDEEDIASAIHNMLSDAARENVGPLKIHRKRKPRVAKIAAGGDMPSIEATITVE